MTQAVLLWVRCPGRSGTAPTIRSPGRAPFVSVLAPLRVKPPVRPSHAHLHDENSCPLAAGQAGPWMRVLSWREYGARRGKVEKRRPAGRTLSRLSTLGEAPCPLTRPSGPAAVQLR